MPFQSVTRRSVPDEVYDQIVGDVLHGALVPGEALPSERRLAEVLGVSRPAVREALQRLAHSGVVNVRQGDLTTINDFRRHAGLDILAHLLVRNGELDLAVARSILESRLHIGPMVAELAAERSGARLAAPLRDSLDALAAAPDAVARQRLALAFWDVVVDGADSIVFRLMYNGLRAAYEPALDVLGSDHGRRGVAVRGVRRPGRCHRGRRRGGCPARGDRSVDAGDASPARRDPHP